MVERAAWLFARVAEATKFLQTPRAKRRRGDTVKAATPIARAGGA